LKKKHKGQLTFLVITLGYLILLFSMFVNFIYDWLETGSFEFFTDIVMYIIYIFFFFGFAGYRFEKENQNAILILLRSCKRFV
jgi:hypothetical protein